jgi:S1-C subfamily serine protease
VASSDGGSFDQGTGEPEEDEGEALDELTDQALGGWVPPELRAWRHPSETGPRASRPAYAAPVVRTRGSGRRTAWVTTLVVGAGAAAALVTGGLMLTAQNVPSSPVRSSTPPLAATRSIVRLEVESANGTNNYGCGVAVAVGGMIATNATLLEGARRVIATTTSGKHEVATVVAIDTRSDVGVVRVHASMPVAHFVDWNDVAPGTGAVVVAVASVSPGSPQPMWWDETINSTSDEVGSGPGSGMVSVVATTPTGVEPQGAVLMEHDGAVVGLLDRFGVPSVGDGAVFLPGDFVEQVARELMADGKVLHGWLGIDGTNSNPGQPEGALVTAVDPNGASNGHLQTGDVIEAINGRRVRSMADLSSRLYVLAPGSWVRLTVERDNTVDTVGLWLDATP